MLNRIDQLEEQVRRIGPLERQVRDLQADLALVRRQHFGNSFGTTWGMPTANPSMYRGGFTSDLAWNHPTVTGHNPSHGSSWTGAGTGSMWHGTMPAANPSLYQGGFTSDISWDNPTAAGAAVPNINFIPYIPTSAAMPVPTNDTMFQDHTMPTGTAHRSSALPTTASMPTNAIIPHTGANYVDVALPLSDAMATSTATASAGVPNVEIPGTTIHGLHGRLT